MSINITHTPDKAWALIHKFDWGTAILGKYCWKDSTENEYKKKIFKTRREAREAKKTCCYDKTRVVRIEINLKVIGID